MIDETTEARIPTTDAEIEAFARELAETIHIQPWTPRRLSVFMIAVDDLPESNPEVAWRVVTRAIDIAPPEARGVLGAGPLEDLLWRHSSRYVPLSIERAKQNPVFRESLEHVWRFQMPLDDWLLLRDFREAFPFTSSPAA